MAYHLNVNYEDHEDLEGAATVAQAMGSEADSVERLARNLVRPLRQQAGLSECGNVQQPGDIVAGHTRGDASSC